MVSRVLISTLCCSIHAPHISINSDIPRILKSQSNSIHAKFNHFSLQLCQCRFQALNGLRRAPFSELFPSWWTFIWSWLSWIDFIQCLFSLLVDIFRVFYPTLSLERLWSEPWRDHSPSLQFWASLCEQLSIILMLNRVLKLFLHCKYWCKIR